MNIQLQNNFRRNISYYLSALNHSFKREIKLFSEIAALLKINLFWKFISSIPGICCTYLRNENNAGKRVSFGNVVKKDGA